MSNYYKYVNHTLRERVDLDPWIASGETMQLAHAILFGGVLAYLMFPRGSEAPDRKFLGRWGIRPCPDILDVEDANVLRMQMLQMRRSAQSVAVTGDYSHEWDMSTEYMDIAPGLVAEMRNVGLWRLVEQGANRRNPDDSDGSSGYQE